MITEITEQFLQTLENMNIEELERIDNSLFKQISEYNRTQTNAKRAFYLQKVRNIIHLIQSLTE